MAKQLFLDLDFSPPDVPEHEIDPQTHLRGVDLRRAALGWMARQDAAGLAVTVPTRLSSYLANVAGFWNRPKTFRKNPGPGRLHVPCHTMIIECRQRRQDCWPDFTRSSALLPELRNLKQQRLDLEADIRANEPHLRETATLFDEYSEWAYSRSTNRDYHRVCHEIDLLNHALYHGTRFEFIRSAHVADFLYLAVPEKSVHPRELADGWGLLWVDRQMNVELIARAENQQAPVENRFHLVQNIAAAACQDVLFSYGVRLVKGDARYVPRPHRRQPKPRGPNRRQSF